MHRCQGAGSVHPPPSNSQVEPRRRGNDQAIAAELVSTTSPIDLQLQQAGGWATSSRQDGNRSHAGHDCQPLPSAGAAVSGAPSPCRRQASSIMRALQGKAVITQPLPEIVRGAGRKNQQTGGACVRKNRSGHQRLKAEDRGQPPRAPACLGGAQAKPVPSPPSRKREGSGRRGFLWPGSGGKRGLAAQDHWVATRDLNGPGPLRSAATEVGPCRWPFLGGDYCYAGSSQTLSSLAMEEVEGRITRRPAG